MLVPGHIAIGYIISYIVSKHTGKAYNIPLIWFFSLLPDLDFMIPGLYHGGLTHTVSFVLLLSLPLIFMYREEGFLALLLLLGHILLGDLPVNMRGYMLFWPFSYRWYSIPFSRMIKIALSNYLELAVFTAFIILFIYQKDYKRIFNRTQHDFLVLIPFTGMVLTMVFTGFFYITVFDVASHLLMIGIITRNFIQVYNQENNSETRERNIN